jgi:outer membrane biosynthesis protein TonB
LSRLRRLIAGSARAPLFLLCALVLATVVVPVALADDPPPTTTTPAPAPTPDPAPPKPKPKPAPRSQPRPRPTPTPTPTPTPSPSSSPQPNVVHVQKPVVKKPVRKHVQPKKKVHRKKVVAKKPQPIVPTIITPPQVSGAAIGSTSVLHPKSPASGGLASIFIVIALSFAIASLAVALIPANRVPWRPVAVFVSDRQVDLTVAGFALLVATAFTLILTGGL